MTEAEFFAKYEPLGRSLCVGQRVVERGENRWLGTVVKKYPHGGGQVINDHCGTGGGGPAALGAFVRATGESVPIDVVDKIIAARDRWSALHGCCKRDDAVTRVIATYFATLGRVERKPRHLAWPRPRR